MSVSWRRTQIAEDPAKYRGFDAVGRPLEIVALVGEGGVEVVIHAMKDAKDVCTERGTPMSFELTDHVPGLSDEQLAQAITEAEAGYDLDGLVSVPNPHFGDVTLVPADLLEAIAARAARDGQSPEAVIREALTAYLAS